MTTSGRLDNARGALISNVTRIHTHDGVRPGLKLGQPADVIPLDMSPMGKL